MRILVVEDEQDLNRILAKTLKAEGYSVDSCFDGVEALDYLKGAEYDAVVLDVMMPKVDGFEVCRRIREVDENVPVLFLSARDGIIDKRIGFSFGGEEYLDGAISIAVYVRKIREKIEENPAKPAYLKTVWGVGYSFEA